MQPEFINRPINLSRASMSLELFAAAMDLESQASHRQAAERSGAVSWSSPWWAARLITFLRQQTAGNYHISKAGRWLVVFTHLLSRTVDL